MSASGLQAVHRRSAPLLTLSQDRSMAAAAVVQPPSPAEAKVAQGDATTATTATTATAATAATAALPFLATDASDISTVTRPRSTTSSCNSAPLSTLPSSTSPPLLSVKPHRPHPHSHHHHHHHRLQPHASSPEPLDQRFLAAAATPPPVPPHTSLRPLRVRPPSQLQSSFRSASEQQPLSSFRSASEQQQQQQQQQQQPLAAAPSYYRPYLSDDGQADDVAPSVNSQDLAWDQTRLRIAYLVSTMVVPGGGGGGCGYGYGHPFGYGYSPRGSADVPPSPTSPGRADMGCFPAGSTGGGHRGSMGLGPESAQDRCPEGWPGVDPVKKRRRIAQLRRWADEIAALDDQDQTFCGCVVGTPMPPYDVPESAETSAATSTVAVAVAVGPETSDETSPVQALPGRCDGCGHRLTPVRPYVFVDDSGMPKTRDGATRTLRRAYKSIRDLVSRVKEQSAKESAAKAEVPGAGNTPPLSPKQQHAFNRRLSRMRPWDQWHELNCNYTAGDFFTQTTMYHGHATPAPPDTNPTRPPPPWLHAGAFGHDRQPPTSAAAMAAVAAATAAAAAGELGQDATPHKRATAQTTTSDSESSSTSSRDSGPVNMEARRRRQQRHLDARIRRAQLLLASTNNAAPPPPPAAVGTQQ